MSVFGSIKNFFCEEEKPALVPVHEDVLLVNAADFFPVSIASDTDFMRGAVARAQADDGIKKQVEAEFLAEAQKHKAALDQPRPAAAPAISGTVKPEWQTVSDEL